jgi:hypothetical protein
MAGCQFGKGGDISTQRHELFPVPEGLMIAIKVVGAALSFFIQVWLHVLLQHWVVINKVFSPFPCFMGNLAHVYKQFRYILDQGLFAILILWMEAKFGNMEAFEGPRSFSVGVGWQLQMELETINTIVKVLLFVLKLMMPDAVSLFLSFITFFVLNTFIIFVV